MQALDEIQAIIAERGERLDRDDMNRILLLSVDVPLEASEALAMVHEGIALIVNDPLYKGDVILSDDA